MASRFEKAAIEQALPGLCSAGHLWSSRIRDGEGSKTGTLIAGASSEHSLERSRQLVTDEGPKLPKPWLVRRMDELQIAKTPRAPRSLALPVQST